MTDKFTHIPAAYEIVSLEYIDEIKSQAALLRHRKTGARIAVLANDDENKTFNIGFQTLLQRTVPALPHIMEHSVLCGSREFSGKGSVCGIGERFPEHIFECHDLSGQDGLSYCQLQ